ncbi:MAG: hypothetical protein IK073_07700 [Paludibacteraceae bacterium]|nr:hypothetical protein [Paludibacteraceae bacterium]
MRKLFLSLAVCLLTAFAWAGENDLLWDYTEAQIPTSLSDSSAAKNGVLYYGAYVNDAPSTNNGLNGVKLNSSGWAYFEKAAVAGKLKLTFANRKAQTAYAVSVYNATKAEGENPVKGEKIADTEDIDFGGSAMIELGAEVTGVYIERKTGAEGVLQKIEFKENVARTFVDFKIEFRDNPYTVLLPTDGNLPTGVTVENTNYNGGQHGIFGGVITVPVDGPVRFTIGACQYSGTPIVIKKDGVKLLDFSNNASCGETAGHFDQNVTYTYTGGAGVLTFEIAGNTYIPYFFAEATEVTPCTITFKDQNGGVLGTVETIEGATLEAIPYAEADLPAIAEGNEFRGWYYTNEKKAKVGDPINGNTTIQAKVTPIEEATVGSVQTYDFAKEIFYPEDHETVTATNGAFHDGTHGWYFAADGSIDVQVAGNAVVVVTLCTYSESGDVMVMNGENVLNTFSVVKQETADGAELVAKYTGEATTLTIKWTAKQYIHKVVVYNVEGFVEKDEATGYIMVPAGDAASFILALVQAESGDKVFLPNGLYDLGETVLTTISKNNLSIIGQSMEGVIIKNAPDVKTESIDKTATIKIAKNVQGTYLQDLTIQNALDYYKADNGRAVALWDQGTQTVCKNVKLLSYQDTYYSNLVKAVKYFEDCEIHGTVDFICGDGSVYFKNNLLYAEKRKKDGGGSDALTASNADALDHGYVFEGCTIKSECPVVSFGRAWNNTPQVAFLNTLVDYSAGQFSFSDGDKIQRWTKELMNKGAWPMFLEYNTHLADGTVLTPASNEVTFIDPKDNNATTTYETVISAEGAAFRTMEETLGEWSTTAQAEATQAVCEEQWSELEADAIYLAEANGEFVMLVKGSEVMDQLAVYDGVEYTLRKANTRGGFGLTAAQQHEGIESVQQRAKSVQKILRDGQVLILRDGKTFDLMGTELK